MQKNKTKGRKMKSEKFNASKSSPVYGRNMTDRTKYNLQFARDCVLWFFGALFILFITMHGILGHKWALYVLSLIGFCVMGFIFNEMRKDYIRDKELDKFFAEGGRFE